MMDLWDAMISFIAQQEESPRQIPEARYYITENRQHLKFPAIALEREGAYFELKGNTFSYTMYGDGRPNAVEFDDERFTRMRGLLEEEGFRITEQPRLGQLCGASQTAEKTVHTQEDLETAVASAYRIEVK